MEHNSEFKFAVILSSILLVFIAIGFFHPVALDWGVAFTGFLPWPVIALIVILTIVAIFITSRPDIEQFIVRFSNEMDGRPFTLLGSILLFYIIAAIILRVRASLLGDSYTLIYNFIDYQNGVSILAPWHEPLSIYVLYYLVHWLGPLQYPQIYASFSIAEIIFGCGFIFITFFIVKNLFTEPPKRLLTLLFLLVIPYMEFFLGYIEIYSVSTFLLALYILCSVMVLNGRKIFWILPVVYVLVTFSHYINGLLGLSLLYVIYKEYWQNRKKDLAIGITIGIALIIGIFALARFDPARLIDSSPMSHILSLTSDISPINDYSQAYTIVSFFHAVDVGNYLLFMSPFAIAFMLRWVVRKEIGIRDLDTNGIWLAIATIPMFLFLGIAKLEQGFGSDWDVFAADFFLLNLFFAYLFHNRRNGSGIRVFLLILLSSSLIAAPWYILNATREPSIKRFQSLWDTRILSHLGHYTHTLRLTRYYDAEGEQTKIIDAWKHYTELFPGDPRGFENHVDALTAFAPDLLNRRDSVFNAWLRLDPANADLKQRYSSFCLTVGNFVLGRGDTTHAITYYQKAIIFDSSQSRAFNNLGTVFAQKNQNNQAIPLFQKAISLDPKYSDAWYNLGMIYFDKGDKQQAEEMMIGSARLGNSAAQEYLKSVHKSW
jgi:hypothetical protein